MRRFLPLLLLLIAPALFAAAAFEDVAFADAEQQARYERLIAELRCPKCLNSNLAGSDAPIAASLRTEIREQLAEGRSDEEIIEFMTARYGDFVLYRPRLTPGTAALWFGPLVLLLVGFVVLRRMLITARAGHEEQLSPEELHKLHTLLDEKDAR